MNRVQRLKRQQFAIVFLHFDVAVVVAAVAKQQQITWHVALAGSAVVKQFHQTAIGCGIGRSRRKFVVNLIDIDHLHAEVLKGAMCLGQALGFG